MGIQRSGRLLSLDVLRGITIAGMILVNNSGNSDHVYAPLRHIQWNGLTPTDLVFPFFMFIMGVSMYLSLKAYQWELTGECLKKIIKRSVLIFLVGYALNWFGYGLSKFVSLSELPFTERMLNSFLDFQNIRVLGVMQRLAIVYFAGSILGCLLKNPRKILWTSGIILIVYWIFLALFDGFSFSENNIIAWIDLKLLGEPCMYHLSMEGVRIAFDPEGFFSSISGIAHVLFGYYCGYLILNSRNDYEKTIRNLFIFGTIILFAGFLLSYGCPINKKIWSSSFTLVTCGFATLFLALLIWIIDIKGRTKWSRYFESFGINPLFLYVTGTLLGSVFSVFKWKQFIYAQILNPYLECYFASLVYSLLFVSMVWLIGYILYRKRIYIKL